MNVMSNLPLPAGFGVIPRGDHLGPDGQELGVHPNNWVPTDRLMPHAAPSPHADINDQLLNQRIAAHQDDLNEWKHAGVDLSEAVKKIRGWASELWEFFIPSEWQGKGIACPEFLFRFDWEHPRVLGHYVPGRNDTGLRWEISINPRHLRSRSEVDTAATVLHELLHCFEDLAGRAREHANNYHSAWFRQQAEAHGIPCTRYGGDLGVRNPSPFLEWARARALRGEPTIRAAALAVEQPPVSRAKRAVWICWCTPSEAVSVLVARGAELEAVCQRCGKKFRRRDEPGD
jgi:hypothetical protein